jgi:hypothetical protein
MSTVSSSVDNDPFEALRRALEDQSARDAHDKAVQNQNGQPQAPDAPRSPGPAVHGDRGITSKAVAGGAFVNGAGPVVNDAVDGSQPPTQAPAQLNLNAPQLPDPTGPTASPQDLEQFVGNKAAQPQGTPQDFSSQAPDYFDTGSLVWMALQVMTDANQQDFGIASRLKIAMDNAKISEKKNELDDTRDRIDGERKSALTKFVSATAGALSGMAVGYLGAHFTFGSGGSQKGYAMGAALQAGGQGVSQMVTTYGDLLDKTLGGQHQADEASIREKDAQIMQEIYQQVSDSVSSWIDAVKDQRKKAQQTLMDFVDRQKQAVDMVWR